MERITTFIGKCLKGEFCYLQTDNRKIVSVHCSPTDDHKGINNKSGIASSFQAKFGIKIKQKNLVLDPCMCYTSGKSWLSYCIATECAKNINSLPEKMNI